MNRKRKICEGGKEELDGGKEVLYIYTLKCRKEMCLVENRWGKGRIRGGKGRIRRKKRIIEWRKGGNKSKCRKEMCLEEERKDFRREERKN